MVELLKANEGSIDRMSVTLLFLSSSMLLVEIVLLQQPTYCCFSPDAAPPT
jgi:hypothetical protein